MTTTQPRSGSPSVGTPSSEEPAAALNSIDLTDTAAIRQALDSQVVETVVNSLGYPRDCFVEDVKLALGALTIGIAIMAHLLPGKLPDHWWLLFMCVTGYALLSTAHTLFSYLVEKDFFLHTKKHPKGRPAIRLESRMPKYSQEYTLVVNCPSDKRWHASKVIDVANYFHQDGYLSVTAFKEWVKGFVKSFEANQKKRL